MDLTQGGNKGGKMTKVGNQHTHKENNRVPNAEPCRNVPQTYTMMPSRQIRELSILEIDWEQTTKYKTDNSI